MRDLRRKGISTAEIAEELHRSPRMVRKILKRRNQRRPLPPGAPGAR
ncbi:helix-turn-helix domain-containing protein [Microbacterium sp. NRRL B-14842]